MASDPIRILIVDDDEDVLMPLERLLEGEGYNTVTAWSAHDALAQSHKSQFELLLVDENLGDANTQSVLEDLRRAQPLPSSCSCTLAATAPASPCPDSPRSASGNMQI